MKRFSIVVLILGFVLLITSLSFGAGSSLIGSSQIRDNSIRSKDVRNGTLAERDLNVAVKAKLNRPLVTNDVVPLLPVPVVGPMGATGASGLNGQDSTVPGPGPSQEQVNLGVSNFCAVNPCGVNGADGSPGTDCQGLAPISPPRTCEGATGPGPTEEEIAAAVSDFCASHGGCVGPAGRAPTATEIANAVSDYCDSHDLCRGPAGSDGADPTPAQIASAVSSYCDSHSNCQGPAGADATDAQVASSVDSYCTAHDNCQGPAGGFAGVTIAERSLTGLTVPSSPVAFDVTCSSGELVGGGFDIGDRTFSVVSSFPVDVGTWRVVIHSNSSTFLPASKIYAICAT